MRTTHPESQNGGRKKNSSSLDRIPKHVAADIPLLKEEQEMEGTQLSRLFHSFRIEDQDKEKPSSFRSHYSDGGK